MSSPCSRRSSRSIVRYEPASERRRAAVCVEAAKAGDQSALERVITGVQDDIFRLALRMTGCSEDARDACQEVLVKVVTRVDSFQGQSSIRTWAHAIATRHLHDRRKSRVEALQMSFERSGADLLDGLAAEPDPDPLLAEEVKLGRPSSEAALPRTPLSAGGSSPRRARGLPPGGRDRMNGRRSAGRHSVG